MDSVLFIPKGGDSLIIQGFYFVEKKFDFLRIVPSPALLADRNMVLYTLVIIILWSCTASIYILLHIFQVIPYRTL